ncbi:choice-of-anchor A family protein [Paenibacillus sp. DMB5]|uniref:choice-of-anchor A family protein n=1 Tax=Paenibacillus sp. DMB5 TaxID=1780103 RepID=UPI00076CB02F|nr:choice-of-anchor A family protein [Paenibacillus sp. DMB5]KUP23893.1 hypothetical protein AWJ19_12120 [Paenibacillus sp. DMB5]
MKRIKKKRLYFVSGLALVMLLVLLLRNLVVDVFADQTTGTIVNANLSLARSITNTAGETVTNQITRGEVYNLKYTITPQPVPSSTTPSVLQKTVSDIRFEERLPAQINVLPTDLPTGFTISGTIDTGLILTGSLSDIAYTWKSEKQAFIAEPAETQGIISLNIPFTPVVNTELIFKSATLKYTDMPLSNVTSSTSAATSTPTPTGPASTFDPSKSSSSSPLGIAGDYNAFIFGDTSMYGGGDIGGTLASGGNVILNRMTINVKTKMNTKYAVIAGKDIDFREGTVSGSILYGGNKIKIGTIPAGATVDYGVLITPEDFKEARIYYKNLSNSLASIKANGTTFPQYGGLYLTSNSSTAVFDIKNSEFNNINWTNLDNVKNAKTILYNFLDTNIVFNKGFILPSGVTAKQVIYNFPNATSIEFKNTEVSGSIIAPLASINFTNGGQIHGNVIAENLTASSLIDYYAYNTELPKPAATATPVPTATPTATPTPVPTAPPIVTITFPDLDPVTVVDPVDNTPRTLTLQGESIVKLGTKTDLKAIYTGPATEKDITYTWIVTQDGKDVTASKLKNGTDNTQKVLDTSEVGDYKVIVKVNSSNLKVETIAEKIISVRSLTIDGPDNIFVTKTKDFTLTTGNIPANSVINWSITKSDEQYATLSKASGDTTNTKYTLTGKQIHNGVVITVEAGGITETRTVNIIPFSLTGLSAIGEIEINVGQELDLNRLLHATPSEMNIDDIKNQFSWTSNMPHIANFDSNPTDERKGIIRGIQKGENVLATVSYAPPGTTSPITATIRVKVNTPPNGDLY